MGNGSIKYLKMANHVQISQSRMILTNTVLYCVRPTKVLSSADGDSIGAASIIPEKAWHSAIRGPRAQTDGVAIMGAARLVETGARLKPDDLGRWLVRRKRGDRRSSKSRRSAFRHRHGQGLNVSGGRDEQRDERNDD
jgi:hypothetical protein